MISFIEFLTEARRNPDQNPKVSGYQRFLERYRKAGKIPGTNQTNLFLSFQNLEKLGINPVNPSGATPSGVFAYTADYVMKTVDPDLESFGALPYKGRAKHIYMFSAKGNIIDLDSINYNDSKKYIEAMRDYAFENGPNHGQVKRQDFFDLMDFRSSNPSAHPGVSFWQASRDAMTYFSGPRKPSVFQWNKIFRAIGVDGVIDSHGTIHVGEPNQAVFFTPKVIVDKEMHLNKYSKMELDHSKAMAEISMSVKEFRNDWISGKMNHSVKAEYLANARGTPSDYNPLSYDQYFKLFEKESIKDKEKIFNEMVNNYNSGDPFSNSATIMRYMAVAGPLSNNTIRIVLNNKKLFTDNDIMSSLSVLNYIYPSHNKNISTTLIYAILKRVIDANLLKQPAHQRHFNELYPALLRMNAASVGQSSAKKAVKEQLATLYAKAND